METFYTDHFTKYIYICRHFTPNILQSTFKYVDILHTAFYKVYLYMQTFYTEHFTKYIYICRHFTQNILQNTFIYVDILHLHNTFTQKILRMNLLQMIFYQMYFTAGHFIQYILYSTFYTEHFTQNISLRTFYTEHFRQ